MEVGKSKGVVGLIPVIRWRVGNNNNRELVFDLLDPAQDERFAWIINKHFPQHQLGVDMRSFNPTIGYFAVCHFSPEIKDNSDNWKIRDSYSPDCLNTMSIGPTQVGPYAIKLADTIRNAPFYSRAEEYIKSTAKPL